MYVHIHDMQRNNDCALRGLQAPGMRERMANIDAVPAGNSSEAFTQYVREDIARWAKVVKAAGIAPQ